MQPWVLWTLAGVTSVAALWAVISAVKASGRAKADRAKARNAALTEGGRLAFREPQQREPLTPLDALTDSGAYITQGKGEQKPISRWSPAEVDWLLAKPLHQAEARRVMTPDGPMILTRPPFKLRRSIMSHREREYARSIAVRMPSGFVMCPQVRLDALLTPTAPKDRPIDDWRNWRRRVRLRAVDFVICRMEDWSPVLALEVEPRERSTAAETRDKMIDETLAEVGLTLIRCSGEPEKDWAMIKPYLTEPVAPDALDDTAPGPG